MTNKTMPERIWLQGDAEDLDDVSWRRELTWEDDIEYIRADLVTGNAKEPLANGQSRWAVKSGIGWFVIVIHELPGGFSGTHQVMTIRFTMSMNYQKSAL